MNNKVTIPIKLLVPVLTKSHEPPLRIGVHRPRAPGECFGLTV